MRPPAILADDLTGALDTAAQMTGRWGPIEVGFDLGSVPLAPPAAISSRSRDLDARQAARRALTAAAALAGGPTFKKIDSLLRGPWPEELAALFSRGGFSGCVLAPAFPAQGRVTRGGQQIAPGQDPIDIAAQLARAGLAVAPAGPVRIADATSDADLSRIVAGEPAANLLWCGSAGLARAVAGCPPRAPAVPSGPVLAIVGSDHPVSRAQVEAVTARLPQSRLHLRPSHAATVRATLSAFLQGVAGARLVTFDLPPGLPRDAAATAIAAALAGLLPSLPPPARLVVTGGATLEAALAALSCRRLICEGEIGPGLPVSRLKDGLWAGTILLSKSGAFGGPKTLLALCNPTVSHADERF